MPDHGLLTPGTWRSSALADDEALLQAMLDVEVSWTDTLVTLGLAPTQTADAVRACAAGTAYDVVAVARRAEGGGNPVIPLVADLRAAVAARSPEAAGWVHRGLTSQDVLDTALMLVSRQVLEQVQASLATASAALARLVGTHRGTVMAGRTLTQHALPTTFGLVAAGWLNGLLDSLDGIDQVAGELPVQCGGAVGTLAAVEAMAPGAGIEAPRILAGALGLVEPPLAWHTARGPVTRVADALVQVSDVLGKVASDVALLARPEIGELAEPAAPGRGVSSSLPQKRNPVLSILIRSAAMTAPHLASQLHLAAALAVDQRPDGAWHAEWPAFRQLLVRVSSAASELAELLDGLVVDAAAMARNAALTGPALLGERTLHDARGEASENDPGRDLAGYLGVADPLVERVLERAARRHRNPTQGRPTWGP